MKIYVASSWRNQIQPGIVQQLRQLGHDVYDFKNPKPGDTGFSWADVDPNWQNWSPDEYVKHLNHPTAQRGFTSDFKAMVWADCCVMVLPCGRSANTEAGWMKGAGKRVFVYQQTAEEPELMYKLYDGILTSADQLTKQFSSSI